MHVDRPQAHAAFGIRMGAALGIFLGARLKGGDHPLLPVSDPQQDRGRNPLLLDPLGQVRDRLGQVAQARIHLCPARLALRDHLLQGLHLLAHMGHERGDIDALARHLGGRRKLVLALGRGIAQPGDGGHPFFQFAEKTALTVAGKKLQQAHDQRTRQPQQRGRKRRAHAAQLPFEPAHQAVEHLHTALALLRGKAADGLDHRRDGGGKAEESSQKTKENQ